MARTRGKTAARNAGLKSGGDVPLQAMIPARIKREVILRAAQEGTTQRTIILRALRSIGVVVTDDELCDRRKVR